MEIRVFFVRKAPPWKYKVFSQPKIPKIVRNFEIWQIPFCEESQTK